MEPSCVQNEHWQLTKDTVLERNEHMLNNVSMSDVQFTCGLEKKRRFYGHKYVLGTSSPVFFAMFYGELSEAETSIHLADTDEETMEEFLRFIYTQDCHIDFENALSLLYLAEKYMIPQLAQRCVVLLTETVNSSNVLTILEEAAQFQEKQLEDACWKVVEEKTSDVVNYKEFLELTLSAVIQLLKRKMLNIHEIDLFLAVMQWCDYQCFQQGIEANGENKRNVLGDGLYQIAFQCMTKDEFVEYVLPSKLLSEDEILPIYSQLLGLSSGQLAWSLPEREEYDPKLVRLARCTPKHVVFSTGYCQSQPGWQYDKQTKDCLRFSLNKKVRFHGVRLLSCYQSEKYAVALKVNNVKVSGVYVSERDGNNVPGFDVFLPKYINVAANEKVRMSVKIYGPPSYYVTNGQRSIVDSELKATFFNLKEARNATSVNYGQFYQLIVSL